MAEGELKLLKKLLLNNPRHLQASPFGKGGSSGIYEGDLKDLPRMMEKDLSYRLFMEYQSNRRLERPALRGSVRSTPVFAAEKPILWEWKRTIEQRLIGLRLTIHPGTHPRPVTEGIPFLGFIVFPYKRRLKRRKGVQFQRKLRNLLDAYEHGEILTDTLVASIRGWANHVHYGNTAGLRKAILASVPEEILGSIRRC